jgi:BlaI family penicillinase repressor
VICDTLAELLSENYEQRRQADSSVISRNAQSENGEARASWRSAIFSIRVDARDKLSMILQDNLSRPSILDVPMTSERLPAVTEAELAVLEELWSRNQATIRELRDALYPSEGGSKFATVQKLLTRLETKGLVRRHKTESNWIFEPRVARGDLIGGELRRVAERLGGNSLTPLLTYLVETGELTAKERTHLRQLLDKIPDAARSPKTKRS